MRLKLKFALPNDEPADWRDWKPWFAWYPKIIGGTFVWLERIEYRPAGLYPPTLVFPCDYRFPPREDAGA